MTTQELIKLCTDAFVPEEKYCHRYSEVAQLQLIELKKLLEIGARYTILEEKTDDKRIVLLIDVPVDFERALTEVQEYDDNIYFLPQPERITGVDWYI